MKKSKFILAFYVGVITLGVASLSMSIAWYATSARLYVNSIDISIDADRDLQISTKRDGEYGDSISYTELDPTGVFIPLTSAHSSTWMATKEDTPIFYDETKFSTYEYADLKSVADRGYFSQKFYLKADDDVFVSIDGSKTSLIANKEYNSSYARTLYDEYQDGHDEYKKNMSIEEIETKLNKIVEAMRFSILVKDVNEYSYTIIEPYKNGDTYLGGLLDNDVDRYYDYYLQEHTDIAYERVYGEIIGEKSNFVYDDGVNEDSDYLEANEEPSAFNARHKAGIKRFNLEKSLENGIEIKKEKTYDIHDFDSNVKPYHFPVYRDTPKEITVSIYIEGWDLDSVNYTMGAAFMSNFTFMIEREM